MVALLIVVLVLVDILIALFVLVDLLLVALVTLILWLETSFLCISVVCALCSKARLRLSHLVELLVSAPLPICVLVVLKYFVLLILGVLIL